MLDGAARGSTGSSPARRRPRGCCWSSLGQTYGGLGLYDQAITVHTKARAVREAVLGPDHPDTLASRNNLANAYWSAGRRSEAIALHEATLKRHEARLGPDHPDTLSSRNDLAIAYWSAGRQSEAIALHEATLKLARPSWAPTTPTRSKAATTWPSPSRRGRLDEAIALYEATSSLEAKLGPDHPHAREPQ